MVINSGVAQYEGNSLTRYNWAVHKCDNCRGTGLVPADKTDLMIYLACLHFGKGFDFKNKREVIRQWRRDGRQLECTACQGHGIWENWY